MTHEELKRPTEVIESIHKHAGAQYSYDNVVKLGRWILHLQSRLSEVAEQYPDTEADGVVFCGKCGQRK